MSDGDSPQLGRATAFAGASGPAPGGAGPEARVVAPASRPGLWVAVVAFWAVLGLLESTAAYVRMRGFGRPVGWPQVLVSNMPWWLIWAVLTPLAIQLSRRIPMHGGRWLRGAVIQLGAALLFASVHLLLEGAVFYYSVSPYRMGIPGAPQTLADQYRMFFGNYLVLGVVTYGVIAGACYALEFYRRYRETALHSARLEAQTARLELGLTEARMHALRTELNPHFFFNALNAVSGLVRRQENDAAVRMLARLGELLRTTLDRDLAPEVPLRDELSLLDRYLDIERVRFGDRLVVEVECDATARDSLVPTLVLQPLVENAIRHGITKRPGNALIQISAHRQGTHLRVTVRDTGEGLDPRVATVRREGIGLSNTRARLAELYGPSASLSLENAPGGGACVTMTLPYRAATEHGHVAIGA